MRKHGLKTLGLCLLTALGLMALNAVAAQAATEWEIETSTGPPPVTKLLNTLNPALESIGGNLEKGPLIKNELLVPGLGLTINCLTADVEAGSHITANGTGRINVLYLGCVVLGAEHICEVLDILAAAKIQLILHSGDNKIYALLLPPAGTTVFAKIVIHHRLPLEPVCNVTTPLPLANGTSVTGSVVFKIPNTLNATHLIEPAAAALFPADKLKYGAQNATLDGAAEVSLNGVAHGNKKWGVEHVTL